MQEIVIEFSEIMKKPTNHTELKPNHELELLLDDYKAVMIKPRKVGDWIAAFRGHFNDLLRREALL